MSRNARGCVHGTQEEKEVHDRVPQRDRIALHPCVITGGKKARPSDELEATCATAATRESMNLVPSTEVRAILKKARGSCAKAKNRNACLGRLAAATKASRVLYITLNPFTPKTTRITGLAVDETGTKVQEKSLELPRIATQSPRDVGSSPPKSVPRPASTPLGPGSPAP